MQRFFDVIFSLIAVILLLLLLFPIALVLRITGEGEVFSNNQGLERMVGHLT